MLPASTVSDALFRSVREILSYWKAKMEVTEAARHRIQLLDMAHKPQHAQCPNRHVMGSDFQPSRVQFLKVRNKHIDPRVS
jgi:hypothetical protein